MFFRQLYDVPLAQASYLIGCQMTGDAIVVDPTRDVEPYVTLAAAEGLRIAYVTETHIHADFVSGARELAARTGATLLLSAEGGRDWQYQYAEEDGARLLRDGDRVMVGNIRFDVMHTPGHTPEHLSFIVTDTPAAAGPMGVLTGDFVFVGDVGRPDLLERAASVANTMVEGASTLFRSLRRFRALPDYLQVWPGHGAGSACGKALGAVPFSTVGYEKLANWGVAATTQGEFVQMVLDGQPEPPRYFAEMKRINRAGPPLLRGFAHPPQLPPDAIRSLMDANAWVIDLRPAPTFALGHVPRTLSIPYNRSFSTWMGWLVPYDVDIVLLVGSTAHDGPPPVISQAVRDLAMIGLDRIAGWLDARALESWQQDGRALAQVPQLSVAEVAADQARGGAHRLNVVDVRGHAEFESGHLPGTPNVPVGWLTSQLDSLPAAPLVLQCQSGSRSSIAASVLLRAGRTDVYNLAGGFSAWTAAGYAVEHGGTPLSAGTGGALMSRASTRLSPQMLELVADRFKALAEPARLQLLQLLMRGERTVGDLVDETGMGIANVSKHLQLLHAASFVTRRKHGLFVYYALADGDVVTLCNLMCGRVTRAARDELRAVARR